MFLAYRTSIRRWPYWANGLFYPSWNRLYRFTSMWTTVMIYHQVFIGATTHDERARQTPYSIERYYYFPFETPTWDQNDAATYVQTDIAIARVKPAMKRHSYLEMRVPLPQQGYLPPQGNGPKKVCNIPFDMD